MKLEAEQTEVLRRLSGVLFFVPCGGKVVHAYYEDNNKWGNHHKTYCKKELIASDRGWNWSDVDFCPKCLERILKNEN